MMRLLELAGPEELECVITDKLEIKFGNNRVFKISGNNIVPVNYEAMLGI